MNQAPSVPSPALKEVRDRAALTDRESELLQRAGDRLFALSRKVAAAQREIERLRVALEQSEILANEIRKSRDVLASQVESLLNEREREYHERAELRRLLASLQSQMQSMLTSFVINQAAPRPLTLLGRASPQRSGHVSMALIEGARS